MESSRVIFKEQSGGFWRFWFYQDGRDWTITEKTAKRLVKQGEFWRIVDATNPA